MTTIKFGTSGWREIIARDFTFDNVRLATQGIAVEDCVFTNTGLYAIAATASVGPWAFVTLWRAVAVVRRWRWRWRCSGS